MNPFPVLQKNPPRSSNPVKPSIEFLESRQLLSAAAISGSVNLAASPTGNFFLPNVTVYVDANNNGALDPGELSTITDASGNYTLSDVPAGPCIVRQILPKDHKQISPTRGFGIHLTAEPGRSLINEDFQDESLDGYIAGSVDVSPTGVPLVNVTFYADLNNDGKLDGNEPSAVTDNAGEFALSGLPPANYIIRQIVPPGYAQLSPQRGFGFHTLPVGLNVENVSFSDVRIGDAGASITGSVLKDLNKIGSAMAGWTVYLDLDNSGALRPADPTSVTAGEAGKYFSFTGLAPGSYIVRVVPQTGWTQTTPAKDFGWHITLSLDQNVTGVLFSEM